MNSVTRLKQQSGNPLKARSASRLAIMSLVFAACGACTHIPPTPDNPEHYQQTSVDGPGVPELVVHGIAEKPRNLPKSAIGNPASYNVFGKRYTVMDSAAGFVEQGVASWYGSKFHGRKTSSGETYNMYNMTAAHKHLPLPTFVEVTNLDNGKQLIVKVNDRGPFVDERIIDLSYGAAARLGVLDTGTARVEITAVTDNLPDDAPLMLAEQQQPVEPVNQSALETGGMAALRRSRERALDAQATTVSASRSETVSPGVVGASTSTPAQAALVSQLHPVSPVVAKARGTVIQVGAFSVRSNAEAMVQRVNRAVSDDAAIIALDGQRNLHRVQIGPLPAEAPLQQILAALRGAGIERVRLFQI